VSLNIAFGNLIVIQGLIGFSKEIKILENQIRTLSGALVSILKEDYRGERKILYFHQSCFYRQKFTKEFDGMS